MQLTSKVVRHADTTASPDAVYALLADVGRSVAHFPELESITEEPAGWVWRLKKLGAGPLSFQVHYQSRYSFDPATRLVKWVPVPGVGNTQVNGVWRIAEGPKGARFTLDTSFTLDMPFPRPLKGTVEAILQRENERIIGEYLTNLVTTLEGGDGRARR